MNLTNENKKFDTIFDALHLTELPEVEQEQIILDLNDLIFQGTIVRLLEQMDEKTQDQFTKLLDLDASEEEVSAFVQKHVPNSHEAIKDTVAELTEDILAVM